MASYGLGKGDGCRLLLISVGCILSGASGAIVAGGLLSLPIVVDRSLWAGTASAFLAGFLIGLSFGTPWAAGTPYGHPTGRVLPSLRKRHARRAVPLLLAGAVAVLFARTPNWGILCCLLISVVVGLRAFLVMYERRCLQHSWSSLFRPSLMLAAASLLFLIAITVLVDLAKEEVYRGNGPGAGLRLVTGDPSLS